MQQNKPLIHSLVLILSMLALTSLGAAARKRGRSPSPAPTAAATAGTATSPADIVVSGTITVGDVEINISGMSQQEILEAVTAATTSRKAIRTGASAGNAAPCEDQKPSPTEETATHVGSSLKPIGSVALSVPEGDKVVTGLTTASATTDEQKTELPLVVDSSLETPPAAAPAMRSPAAPSVPEPPTPRTTLLPAPQARSLLPTPSHFVFERKDPGDYIATRRRAERKPPLLFWEHYPGIRLVLPSDYVQDHKIHREVVRIVEMYQREISVGVSSIADKGDCILTPDLLIKALYGSEGTNFRKKNAHMNNDCYALIDYMMPPIEEETTGLAARIARPFTCVLTSNPALGVLIEKNDLVGVFNAIRKNSWEFYDAVERYGLLDKVKEMVKTNRSFSTMLNLVEALFDRAASFNADKFRLP